MIRRVFLLFIVCSAFLYSQTEYVPVSNKIYNFLNRMDALQIITGYSSFELPKTRHQIASYLKEAENKRDNLDAADRALIDDFKIEFELEFLGSLNNSVSLFGNGDYGVLNQKEKNIYFHN